MTEMIPETKSRRHYVLPTSAVGATSSTSDLFSKRAESIFEYVTPPVLEILLNLVSTKMLLLTELERI